MIDFLASEANLATELLERTSSTPDTLRAVQLSLAPAFLLVGIGSIMNVMMQRLTWLAGRIERLCEQDASQRPDKVVIEIEWLRHRRRLARRAIMFSTAAAVIISLVIAVLFTSVYIEARIGTVVASLWVVTVVLLITGLAHFLRETLLAANGPNDQPSK